MVWSRNNSEITITDPIQDRCTFNISGRPAKVANEVTLNCATLSYNGSNQALLSSATALSQNGVYVSTSPLDASNYNTLGSTDLSSATGLNATTYDVYAYAPTDNNYFEGTAHVTCSITKATSNPITLNCASLTYTAEAQALLSSKTAQYGGTVYISQSSLTASNYTNGSTSVSAIKKTDAGSYTIYAYVPETANAKAGSTNKACTIARKSITFPTCTEKTFTGSSQTLFKAHSGNYSNDVLYIFLCKQFVC